jgi:hypothetical protein
VRACVRACVRAVQTDNGYIDEEGVYVEDKKEKADPRDAWLEDFAERNKGQFAKQVAEEVRACCLFDLPQHGDGLTCAMGAVGGRGGAGGGGGGGGGAAANDEHRED